MQKKITITVCLGFVGVFSAQTAFSQEQYAINLGVYPACTGCHTSQSNPRKGSGLLPGAAWNKLAKLALTCVLPQVLNTAKTACVNSPPPTCAMPQILNTAKTACVTPAPHICSATEVLNATKTACITKPLAPVKNTKPILNFVAPQWDIQVDKLLSIPLSVIDTEQDEFTIIQTTLVGSTLSEIHPDTAGLQSIDFEWTPTQANVNKVFTLTFQAKEKSTKPALVSNKVTVKVRVWAAGDRNAASINKLNVMTSKFSVGSLKLAGNVKFNSLLTATEIQSFVAKNLDLTISDTNGLIDSRPLPLDKKGNWAISIPMISAPCDITLAFAGQNASRSVVGCLKTAQNILAANDNDHDDYDKNKKTR
ncbi:MAG: hypothetical protein EXR89_01185 [Methylococcaceae bacterium]|nr:hypothetical protein [Methylococcaceae bacterium]